MPNKKVLVLSLSVFLLGVISDRIITMAFPPSQQVFVPVRQKGFTYISPLLYYETSEQTTNKGLRNLSSDIKAYIKSLNPDQMQAVSVYFREPTSGNWFVINGSEQYTPASLLKVPILMAYYKEAENNPDVLSKTITYQGETTGEQNILPSQVIQEGKTYRVDDLINRTIMYSDNNAMTLLMNTISNNAFQRVFEEVNIGHLDYANSDNFMTVQKYATFFRILYNASYLNRTMSEKALALLTKTNFSQGIVAGVPAKTLVAHKFGERAYADSGQKQLHDCGIVYMPNHPYLLCVMTKGTSFSDLETVIKTISQKVYNAIII